MAGLHGQGTEMPARPSPNPSREYPGLSGNSGQFLVLSKFPHFECPMVMAAPTYSTIYSKETVSKKLKN